MATLASRISLLSTRIANYIRDSVTPRLLPSGGTSGQVLQKTSATDYATAWKTHKTVQYSVNIGEVGVRQHKPILITINDSDVIASSKIEAWYSPINDAANKEYEDDAEFDYLDVCVVQNSVTSGQFKVSLIGRTNKLINNQKTIMYRVQN